VIEKSRAECTTKGDDSGGRSASPGGSTLSAGAIRPTESGPGTGCPDRLDPGRLRPDGGSAVHAKVRARRRSTGSARSRASRRARRPSSSNRGPLALSRNRIGLKAHSCSGATAGASRPSRPKDRRPERPPGGSLGCGPRAGDGAAARRCNPTTRPTRARAASGSARTRGRAAIWSPLTSDAMLTGRRSGRRPP
jgi:hypothetical protein